MNLTSTHSLVNSSFFFTFSGSKLRFMSHPRLAKLTCGSIEARTTLTGVFLNTFSSVETRCRADTHLKCRTVEKLFVEKNTMSCFPDLARPALVTRRTLTHPRSGAGPTIHTLRPTHGPLAPACKTVFKKRFVR